MNADQLWQELCRLGGVTVHSLPDGRAYVHPRNDPHQEFAARSLEVALSQAYLAQVQGQA